MRQSVGWASERDENTAFFDGPHGGQRLAPLAQRLHVDFETEQRFDNPRAVQGARLERIERRVLPRLSYKTT